MNRTKSPGRPAGPADAESRRQELLLAAYRQIAESGFEGLRTREVADEVGVNVATLHYYFPTKEALIRAVVGHAMSRFRTTFEPGGSPGAQLAAHFRGVRRLYRDEPELFVVMGELAQRSGRDPQIAAIFKEMNDAWHAALRALVKHAQQEGFVSAGLEPDATASLVIATLRGMFMLPAATTTGLRLEQSLSQLEGFLGLKSHARARPGAATRR
jgi:AcrR family transcriptional regulator